MTEPPPPPGYSAQPAGGTNGLAIGALVASIAGFLCGIGLIIGLVLGYIAKNQIDQSGGTQEGRGLAVAAIVIGWIGVAITVIVVIAVSV
jgi:uncharacterized membrane protein